MDTISYLLGKKSGGGSGTSNYSDLTNKPKINNVELNGNKSSSDLGIQDTLISGTNIKTINNQSILGSGDITIGGGSSSIVLEVTTNSQGVISNYNTTDNKNKLLEIFNNYDGDNINIFLHTTNNNEYMPLYMIRKYTAYNSLQLNFAYYYNSGNYSYYGQEYKKIIVYSLYIDFTNGTPNNISITNYNGFIPIDIEHILGTNNTREYTPSGDYNPATKKYVDDKITTYSGYDATKTQVLKNINGVLTWVTEE